MSNTRDQRHAEHERILIEWIGTSTWRRRYVLALYYGVRPLLSVCLLAAAWYLRHDAAGLFEGTATLLVLFWTTRAARHSERYRAARERAARTLALNPLLLVGVAAIGYLMFSGKRGKHR